MEWLKQTAAKVAKENNNTPYPIADQTVESLIAKIEEERHDRIKILNNDEAN